MPRPAGRHSTHRARRRTAMGGRKPPWFAVGLTVGVLTTALVVSAVRGSSDVPARSSPERLFGVLGSSCDPERLSAERAAGISVIEFDMGWDAYEPTRGVFDHGYISDLRNRLQTCRQVGMRVILSLGLQSPPDWVSELPSGSLLDRNGNPPGPESALDVVFSSAVRDAVARYFTSIADDIGFDGVLAIRLGTGAAGELGYPGPDEGSSPNGNDYWAFNEAAQTGRGLADGTSGTPLPDWAPGDANWQGQPVTRDQVKSWFSWYTRSLITAVGWQAGHLRELGFTGAFHVPVAGSGTFPSDLRSALDGNLDGRNDPFGALARGLNYPDQFALLAQLDRRLRAQASGQGIAVDFTGLDDVTAVHARGRTPPQDGCRPGDPDTAAAGTGVRRWSGQRFTIAIARHQGVAVLGENPGASHLPSTGGHPDSDPLPVQLTRAVGYARQCGLSMFLFAFENDLFSGSSGVTLDDYGREINR